MFLHLDGSINEIPSVDIILLRQVLQHLSNNDIRNMLEINLSKSKFCALQSISHHKKFTPNIDKSTGVELTCLDSGVSIEENPFVLIIILQAPIRYRNCCRRFKI